RFLVKPYFRLALALAVCGLSARPADTGNIEFQAMNPALIQQRLEAVTRKLADRKDTLESLFRNAGCDGDRLSETPVPGSKQPNVVCALPGNSAATIVVSGHYDYADRGIGAVDDWSGAALLPSLYQSLRDKPRRHRFVFVAFVGEE